MVLSNVNYYGKLLVKLLSDLIILSLIIVVELYKITFNNLGMNYRTASENINSIFLNIPH